MHEFYHNTWLHSQTTISGILSLSGSSGGSLSKSDKDFTMKKYGELCHALLSAGYAPLTVHQYISCKSSEPAYILRHDVDRKPKNALKMARLEHTLGIHSTYYFRYPYTFKPEIMKEVQSLGHEIGYHYEVLSKAKGDGEKAIELFTEELEAFGSMFDVRTISMHGRPLSRYDNRELWRDYDFRDYGIEGEAYLSLAGKGLQYLTDTGRSWSGKNSLRDIMPDSGAAPVETTDDLIAWLRSSREGGLYLTVHPERWATGGGEWVLSHLIDSISNLGKTIITLVR